MMLMVMADDDHVEAPRQPVRRLIIRRPSDKRAYVSFFNCSLASLVRDIKCQQVQISRGISYIRGQGAAPFA